MQKKFVGRERELKRFAQIRESDAPRFVAIYGRRRVGKTFLVRNAFENEIVFELIGSLNGKKNDQLENFAFALSRASQGQFPESGVPDSWPEAFRQLIKYCESLNQKKKNVLFFDELPWLASPKSGFMEALDHFWNAWGSKQRNLILVVCGSAAAWMIKQVVQNKGGLHNRVTDRFRLLPFDLSESKALLLSRNVRLTDYQIAELYMAVGGIPLYLEQAETGESANQTIERVCFKPDGFLWDEFSQLYPALFDDPDRHIEIVKSLATKQGGLTRNQISAATKIPSSGRLTRTLEELVESAFIRSDPPFDKKVKGTRYRLADEFTRFHLQWMANRRNKTGDWAKIRGTPKWRTWMGNAFELLCLKHVNQIKAALEISGVETDESCWTYQPNDQSETGAQIDLLIDRADACINLCEMKYSENEFAISKSYAKTLRERNATFRSVTKTKKSLFQTFVTTHGIKSNEYALELVDSSITLEALFKPVASK